MSVKGGLFVEGEGLAGGGRVKGEDDGKVNDDYIEVCYMHIE
jgi:hypothetical protein